MSSKFDVTAARKCFPALKGNHQVYLDNAGGSQVLGTVSSACATGSYIMPFESTRLLTFLCRIKDYLEETNVQLGASYNVAQQSTSIYNQGMEAAAAFINAGDDDVGKKRNFPVQSPTPVT